MQHIDDVIWPFRMRRSKPLYVQEAQLRRRAERGTLPQMGYDWYHVYCQSIDWLESDALETALAVTGRAESEAEQLRDFVQEMLTLRKEIYGYAPSEIIDKLMQRRRNGWSSAEFRT